jgi:hypothetical protein
VRPRAFLLPVALLLLVPPRAGAVDGYRLFEATAASVNREVLFRSDVVLEQCLLRCAAMPGSREEPVSLAQARDRLISDTLVLQEQRKLELGQVDNAVLAATVAEAAGRMANCPSPCREDVTRDQLAEWVKRKLLIHDFFRRRVAVFVEIKDEDVRREYRRRAALGDNAQGLSEEKVREEMVDAKVAEEIRNWYARAASKSKVILSPLEEP